MSLLVRSIEALEEFQTADEEGRLKINAADSVPIVVFREFTPSARDAGWLSFFEAEDESDTLRIAAATAILSDSMGKKQAMFLGASKPLVESLGLQLRKNSAGLPHAYADAKHWEVQVVDDKAACALARVFLEGQIFIYEGRTVLNESKRAARANEFNFPKMAEKGSNNPQGRHLLGFVKERTVEVLGQPVK